MDPERSEGERVRAPRDDFLAGEIRPSFLAINVYYFHREIKWYRKGYTLMGEMG